MALTHKLLSLLMVGSVLATAGCQVQPMAAPMAGVPTTRSASLEGVTMGYRQVAQQIFDDLDADKDNVLSAKELDAFKRKGGEPAQILISDRNFDKAVSRDEFLDPAYVKVIVDQIRFQMANLFTRLDKNGDAFLTADELVVAKGPITDELFRKYDRNSNRKLGLSEFEDLMWVDLMPQSVNPMNQLSPDQFPQVPESFSFVVTFANRDKIATVMLKKEDTTGTVAFLRAPDDKIPQRLIREVSPGKYSVTIKQADGIAATRQIDASHATSVTVMATKNGPQISIDAAPAKAVD
jgi:Ca2+-binding EF-hand superfamily protein